MWLADLATVVPKPGGGYIFIPSIVVLVLVYAIGRFVIEWNKRH